MRRISARSNSICLEMFASCRRRLRLKTRAPRIFFLMYVERDLYPSILISASSLATSSSVMRKEIFTVLFVITFLSPLKQYERRLRSLSVREAYKMAPGRGQCLSDKHPSCSLHLTVQTECSSEVTVTKVQIILKLANYTKQSIVIITKMGYICSDNEYNVYQRCRR